MFTFAGVASAARNQSHGDRNTNRINRTTPAENSLVPHASSTTTPADTSSGPDNGASTTRSFIFPSLFIFGNPNHATTTPITTSTSTKATVNATTTATTTAVIPTAGSVYSTIQNKPKNPRTPSVGLRNEKSAAGDASTASAISPYEKARLGVPMTFSLGVTALALGLLGVLLIAGKEGKRAIEKATALPRSIMGNSSRFSSRKMSLGH